jgi:heat shock 70kDa protein 1/2/6/8
LNQEVMQIGQAMYNQPGAGAAGPVPGAEAPGAEPTGSGSGSNRPNDGDVIDADFTESN